MPISGVDLETALNSAQRAAVTAPTGAHLVVAGAGTGKTRTLVYRVAWLVAQGAAPESILLLTFTRRAAREMLRRAAGVLDARCERVAGGTFHGFANQVLRRHAQLLGYQDRYTILDRSDAADVMAVLRTESGYVKRGKRFPRKDTLLDLWSKRVNTGRKLEDLLADGHPQFADDLEAIAELHRRYAARKKKQNVMDYDDLLINLRDLLAEHEEARARMARTFRTLLVDEFQDTNRLQAHITALLAAGHGNVMVVGDEAQSIYAFRGADFRNIMDFPQLFPGCATTVLEQSYRSTQPILDLGNDLLAQAARRYEKRLFSELPGSQKPLLVRTEDEHGQAAYVAERVLALREQGVPLGEMAVLSRAAWHSNQLELELGRRNIPYRKYGGIRFVEAAHVKDACALLRLAANPLDATAWFRVLQLYDGIGPATAQRLGAQVIDAGGDLEALRAPHLARRPFGADLKRLAARLAVLGRADLSLGERLDGAIAYLQKLLPKKYDDAARRARDLESLRVIAERYQELETFLSDLAIDPPELGRLEAQQDPEDEVMTVSTVHSAKGLEWQAVFIIGLVSGHFPNFASLGDADALEEERRLLYVAVTRAQRHLALVKPETVSRRGGYQVAELCPFLADLDLAALVEETVYAPHDDQLTWGKGGDGGDDAALRRIQAYFGDG